jgi:hypothetical protein
MNRPDFSCKPHPATLTDNLVRLAATKDRDAGGLKEAFERQRA